MISTTQNKPAPMFTAVQSQHFGACGSGEACEANCPTHDQIAQGAYEIYVASGWVQGQSAENWLQAERSLRTQSHQAQEKHAETPSSRFAGPTASQSTHAQRQHSR